MRGARRVAAAALALGWLGTALAGVPGMLQRQVEAVAVSLGAPDDVPRALRVTAGGTIQVLFDAGPPRRLLGPAGDPAEAPAAASDARAADRAVPDAACAGGQRVAHRPDLGLAFVACADGTARVRAPGGVARVDAPSLSGWVPVHGLADALVVAAVDPDAPRGPEVVVLGWRADPVRPLGWTPRPLPLGVTVPAPRPRDAEAPVRPDLLVRVRAGRPSAVEVAAHGDDLALRVTDDAGVPSVWRATGALVGL